MPATIVNRTARGRDHPFMMLDDDRGDSADEPRSLSGNTTATSMGVAKAYGRRRLTFSNVS